MQVLQDSDHPDAKQALELFCFRVAKEVAALAQSMGGLDGPVFTAGIGENSPRIRTLVTQRLAWLGTQLDDVANLRRPPHFGQRQPHPRLCGVDQRGMDDRQPHAGPTGRSRHDGLRGLSGSQPPASRSGSLAAPTWRWQAT